VGLGPRTSALKHFVEFFPESRRLAMLRAQEIRSMFGKGWLHLPDFNNQNQAVLATTPFHQAMISGRESPRMATFEAKAKDPR